MGFEGFGPDALTFYDELAQDGSKAFWQANKARYEEHVRRPLELLLDDLFDEFGEAKVFRPYRDTRFSKDKTPYKLNAAATAGLHYVSLGADGVFAGGGRYHLERDELRAYRRAVQEPTHVTRLEEAIAQTTAAGLEVRGEQLKTAPRGIPADHPQLGHLRRTSLYAIRTWEGRPAWLHTAEARERVAETWRASRPLCAWLEAAV